MKMKVNQLIQTLNYLPGYSTSFREMSTTSIDDIHNIRNMSPIRMLKSSFYKQKAESYFLIDEAQSIKQYLTRVS